jgi:hypothetical protein
MMDTFSRIKSPHISCVGLKIIRILTQLMTRVKYHQPGPSSLWFFEKIVFVPILLSIGNQNNIIVSHLVPCDQ